MKTAFCLLAAALLSATGASAQSSTAAGQPSRALLGAVAPTPLAPANAYTQRFAGGGSLTYVGVVASHDAGHAQFAQLRQAFADGQPTLVYYEKPDMGLDSTAAATIGRLGEMGYVRLLARQQQVPAARLDNPVAEYEYLKTRTDLTQLKLYYLLRASQRVQASTGASRRVLTKAMRALLANSAYFMPGCEAVVRNLKELKAAYRQHQPDGSPWYQAPGASLNFNANPASAGGAFITNINRMASEFREQTAYRQALAQAQAGQRVLVVVDRDHLPAAATARPLARQ